ncbi:WhiB family transcriptional regulator [Streptomyces griseosporeus]
MDAWQAPDVDGGEEPEVRAERVRAAKAVCAACPVLDACAVFGASVTAEGRLAEPWSILGGMTALERTKALVVERQQVPVRRAVPVDQLRTPQKLAVLRALAAHEDQEAVAVAAGVDVRTANWQRSRLRTQLGLPRSASRRDILDAAVARGLLTADEVAAAPAVVSAPPAVGLGAGVLPIAGVAGQGAVGRAQLSRRGRARVSRRGGGRPGRGRRTAARPLQVLPGQLAFDFSPPAPSPKARVAALYPTTPVLGVAA